MKVIHLSTTDYGGAYKAAYRISESMCSQGINSKVYVRTKTRDTNECEEVFHNTWEKLVSKVKNVGNLMLSKDEIVSDFFGTDITEYDFFKEADVIVLHWVNSFISYHVISKIIKTGKPFIWVMHDMWLFTGGCHCDRYCKQFESGCGRCKILNSNRKNDISRINFEKKRNMIHHSMVFIGPSNYIVNEANKSEILKNEMIYEIHNPIDINVFKALATQEELKNKYGVNLNKKVILFGAVNSLKDKNKGYLYLKKALNLLDKEKYVAVVFGNKQEDGELHDLLETKFLGFIESEKLLTEIYNLADVFVAPSEQDNYSNSVLEALSCGTPVVAFNIGGMPELIMHKRNGYIAEFKNVSELANGISFCCNNKLQLKEYARKSVQENNRYEVIGQKYVQLCESCINKKDKKTILTE